MSGAVKTFDIAVIGGGASGIFASIFASMGGARVCLLEHKDRIGAKILVTGNGRCNLSHTDISSESYNGSGIKAVSGIYKRFDPDKTLRYFNNIGLITESKNGYIYPVSGQASAVLDVLRYKLRETGVKVFTGYDVTDITPHKGGYLINSDISAARVVICTGGCAAPKTGSDGSGLSIARRLGLKVVKPLPALVKLIASDNALAVCNGVRARGRVKYISGLDEYADEGEIQFTKDGISGIPVFNISRHITRTLDAGNEAAVTLDMAPFLSSMDFEGFLRSRYREMTDDLMTAEEFLTGSVNKKISLYVLKKMGIKPTEPALKLGKSRIMEYVDRVKAIELKITGAYGFDQAQVTSGGIHFDEVDECLQSRKYPGLYFAGEILDIDGICGGYNLQWAFSSGAVAGMSAAGCVYETDNQ